MSGCHVDKVMNLTAQLLIGSVSNSNSDTAGRVGIIHSAQYSVASANPTVDTVPVEGDSTRCNSPK